MDNPTNISPYVRRAAERAGILQPTVILGRFARPEASFARQHTGDLVKSAPIEPMWKTIGTSLFLAAFLVIVIIMSLV